MKALLPLCFLTALCTFNVSANVEAPKKSVYQCKNESCVLEILSFNRETIVHQNLVSSVSLNYLKDELVEVMYRQNGATHYVTVSLNNASIRVSNAIKL
ncbi:hypothetical protein [Thalassotalea agarivorans]|uniref:Uncharacterized protein n=1 Tax=Thalassotalea agarivorans TaxID=349064 RepID=A0A1I0AIM2_THASX|nr:hypothetical protein [Thalassotalea agarivorans]SES94044.1 hypothetical protein SAMN05660429_00718 [Thalassotalea agarivorans]